MFLLLIAKADFSALATDGIGADCSRLADVAQHLNLKTRTEQNTMNYQTTCSSSPDCAVEAEFTEAPKKGLASLFTGWGAPSKPTLERAMQQVKIDRCHAFITAVALRTAATLSDLERLVTTDHPQNAYMCHAFVKSYAEGAVQMVRGPQ